MSMLSKPLSRFGPRIRWLVWGGYVVAWSAALLSPQPVRAASGVLPLSAGFLLSKTLHILAYAGLAVLSRWVLLPSGRRWLPLVFVSVHAMATEYLQGFVPERYPSWLDVGFDHIGILLGVAVTWRWWRGQASPGAEPAAWPREDVEPSLRERV